TYRQQGMIADALRELELSANELQAAGKIEETLPALRKIVGLHPDNIGARIRLAETASQVGKVDEAVHELSQLAVQVKAQGRADDFVRVAERLLFHRPSDFGVARELAAAYIARRNPRLALVKLQAPLKAAPRDPYNVTLLAEALAQLDPSKAVSVWRELAELHDVAGRLQERDAAMRAALAAQLVEEDAGDAALVAERALTLDPSCAAAAKLLGRAVAAPPAPEAIAAALNDELRAELEQVDFFLNQSLFDEARSVLDEL